MTVTQIPGIPYGPAPRTAAVASALAWPPRLVVIHDTSNTASAADEAHYAATRTDAQASWTSAHAYVDGGGPLGSCPLNRQAWAAYSYANANGIHIEMCGMNAGTPNAVPAGTIAITARLVAQLCDLAGIPKVKLSPAQVAAGARGVCGHWDITQGLHVGTHDDPGPAFDWAAFMQAVNAQPAPAPPPPKGNRKMNLLFKDATGLNYGDGQTYRPVSPQAAADIVYMDNNAPGSLKFLLRDNGDGAWTTIPGFEGLGKVVRTGDRTEYAGVLAASVQVQVTQNDVDSAVSKVMTDPNWIGQLAAAVAGHIHVG